MTYTHIRLLHVKRDFCVVFYFFVLSMFVCAFLKLSFAHAAVFAYAMLC